MNLLEFISRKLKGSYLKDYQYLYKIEDAGSDGKLSGIKIDTSFDPDTNSLNFCWFGYFDDEFAGSDLSQVEVISKEDFEYELTNALQTLKDIILK